MFERLQQPFVDAAERTIGHENDQVARPMLADDQLDDPVDGPRVARRLTAHLQIAHQLWNREPSQW